MKVLLAIIRRTRTVAWVAACLLGAGLLVAPAANASASGCTWAPGGALAQQCIYVSGNGLYVSYVDNGYFASPYSGYAANVCNRRHQDKFTNPSGAIGYWEDDPSSCIPGAVAVVTGDYVRWNAQRNFYPNRGMCARSANSDTGGSWSPYACETILP